MSKPPESRSSIFQLLKLSFGGPRSVELPLSCYGKLPVYRDFIRNGLAGAEAQAFKQWLDRGMSRNWEAQDECRDYHFGAHALLLGFPGTGRALIAYVWGSADNEGLRRFPFTFFVSVPTIRGTGHISAIAAAAQFARRAQGWHDDIAAYHDVESLVQAVRSRKVALTFPGDEDALQRLREALSGVTVRAFAESLYGDGAGRMFPALVAWLRRRQGSEPGLALAGRLPGSPLLPAMHQAELWAAMLRDEKGRGPAALNLLVPLAGDAGAGPILLGRELRPEDVLAFHPELPGYEQVEDLRHSVPGAAEPAPAWLDQHGGEPLAALLDVDAAGRA